MVYGTLITILTGVYRPIYWLVVGNMFYFSIYWEESSQLTFIFFRGVETTNQIVYYSYIM